MSDPANDARYRSGAEFSEWTSEAPVGVRSTMRTVDRFMGRKVESRAEITMWDPPNKYAFKSVGGNFPARYTLIFEPIDNGTRLTSRGEIEFKGIFKIVEWIFGKQIKTQAQSDFDKLKILLKEN